jgi:hypothetical protein
MAGLIRVAGHLLAGGDAAEDEDRLDAAFDAGHDVGVHPVADHHGVLRVDAQVIERRAHHQRVGFADEEGADAGGFFDERRHRAAGRHQPAVRRPGRVGVGGDEPRAAGHQPDAVRDALQVIAVRLAQHHVVGGVVGDDVAGGVEGLRQPALADDEGRAVGPLRLQKGGRGQRRGVDALRGDVQPGRLQAMGQVARRVERVVGQQQVLRPARLEQRNEPIRPRDEGVAPDEDAVHVDQEVLRIHLVSVSLALRAARLRFQLNQTKIAVLGLALAAIQK